MRVVAKKGQYVDIPVRRINIGGKPQQIAFLLLDKWEEAQKAQKDAGLVPEKLDKFDDVFEGLEA